MKKTFTIEEIKQTILSLPKYLVEFKTPVNIDGNLDKEIETIEVDMFLLRLMGSDMNDYIKYKTANKMSEKTIHEVISLGENKFQYRGVSFKEEPNGTRIRFNIENDWEIYSDPFIIYFSYEELKVIVIKAIDSYFTYIDAQPTKFEKQMMAITMASDGNKRCTTLLKVLMEYIDNTTI